MSASPVRRWIQLVKGSADRAVISTSGASRAASSTSRSGIPQNTRQRRSEEHTSELQSLKRNSYAGYCLKKKKKNKFETNKTSNHDIHEYIVIKSLTNRR